MKAKNLLLMATMLLSGLSGFAQTSNKCGDNLYWSYDSSTKQLIITGTGDMYNYLSAFDSPWESNYQNITSLSLPDGITSIGDYAFCYCKITSLTIPESITSIGRNAFLYCSSLTTVNFNAINCTNMSVGGILGTPFDYCGALSTLNIGDKVKNIPIYAFYQCASITSLTIGNSVTSIGGQAFQYCTGITSLTIPNSVTKIGSSAFQGCSGLISLTIGNSVTLIDDYAFDSCSGLTSLTIPKSVTLIGEGAFSSSTFTQITSNPTTPPTIYKYTFANATKDIPVKIPCDHVNDYKTAQYWEDFTNYQCISTGIKENKIQKFQIYPNPAKDEIFIRSASHVKKVEIYSLAGALRLTDNNFSGKISIASLSQGVYMVKVFTDTGLVVSKVVKE